MLAVVEDGAGNHRPWRWIALLALVFAIQVGSLWYPTPDAVSYLSIARSIAVDHIPANHGSSHLYYSIGYPVLISPAFLLDDRPFLYLSLLHFLWAVVLILGIFCWAQRCAPEGAFWITALSVVNVSVWCLYRRALSEIAFMAILTLIANSSSRIWKSEAFRGRICWTGCVASLIMLLALIRPVGIMVAAGFGLAAVRSAFAGQIRWGQAVATTLAIGIPGSVALVGMIDHDRQEANQNRGASYVRQIVDSDTTPVEQLIEGIRTRINETGRLIVPGMYKCSNRRGSWFNANMAVYVPLCLLICLGWARLLAKTNDVLAWTLPCYMLVYIIWPYEQATRFVTPMMPVWVASLWLVFARLQPNRRRILYSIVLAAHFAAAMGYWLFDELRSARKIDREWPEAEQLYEPIREEGRPIMASERIGDFRYPLEYLLDRPVRPWQTNDAVPEEFNWLVLSDGEQAPEGFVLWREAGQFRLFKREPAEN